MKKRKLLLPVAILAVVMLVGFTSCSPGDLKAFEGVLQKIDGLSGNVTVTLKDGTTTTFNLNDINMETIRKALGDAGLEPGDNVTFEKGRHGEVKELKVRNAEIQGTIKSLGTDNVTITTKKGDITLQVTPETLIRGGGKEKPVFSDLKVGQRIEVKYDVSTLKALTITIDANGKIQDNQDNKKTQDNHDNQGNKGHKT
jgi:hypothetical protein